MWTNEEVAEANKALKRKGSGMRIELSQLRTEFNLKGDKPGDGELLMRVVNEVLRPKR